MRRPALDATARAAAVRRSRSRRRDGRVDGRAQLLRALGLQEAVVEEERRGALDPEPQAPVPALVSFELPPAEGEVVHSDRWFAPLNPRAPPAP